MSIAILKDNTTALFQLIFNSVKDPEKYCWYIMFIDGTTNGSGITYQEIAAKVNDSPFGYVAGPDEIRHIVHSFAQLYNIFLVGSVNEIQLPKNTDEIQLYQSCNFVIELCDCSFWKVFADDKAYFERLKNIVQLAEYSQA